MLRYPERVGAATGRNEETDEKKVQTRMREFFVWFGGKIDVQWTDQGFSLHDAEK